MNGRTLLLRMKVCGGFAACSVLKYQTLKWNDLAASGTDAF